MNIPDDLKTLILGASRHRELGRRETLLLEGDVSKHFHFVETGCLRLWHNDDGRDITVQFFLGGEMVASQDSFFGNRPSRFSIEAVVPSAVRSMTKTDFHKLIDASEPFRVFMLDVLLSRLNVFQELFLSRIKDTPEQRYRELRAQNPALFDTVPRRDIASFLGITPVSLSRITRKVENR